MALKIGTNVRINNRYPSEDPPIGLPDIARRGLIGVVRSKPCESGLIVVQRDTDPECTWLMYESELDPVEA